MTKSKSKKPTGYIYRVALVDVQSFYVDVMATSITEAMEKVSVGMKRPSFAPIADETNYRGYRIEDCNRLEGKVLEWTDVDEEVSKIKV